MLAPEQKMRFFALVMMTDESPDVRIEYAAAIVQLMSTPRSYEFNFSL